MGKSIDDRIAYPWEEAQRPFHIIENIYYVGTKWVSSFLIDTPEGLILIDCGYREVFYQLIDSVYQLGFDPRNIKVLLLTHGHFDHCGAAKELQEMSGCKIWLSRDDAYFFTDRRDLILYEEHVGQFKIDNFYDYTKPVEFGGMSIMPVHCPGHTPGTTCLFMTVDHKGRKLVAGIHGGLGSNGLSTQELLENGLPEDTRERMIAQLMQMKNMPVDILLPSHAGHAVDHDIFTVAENDDGSGDGFVDPYAWRKMLEDRIERLKKVI